MTGTFGPVSAYSTQTPDAILEALPVLEGMLSRLVGLLGPWPTVGVIVAVLAASLFFRWMADRRRERGWQLAIDEKERTVQRLAQQERAWRVMFISDKQKLQVAQVEKLLGDEDDLRETAEDRVARLKPDQKKGR
jgi:hypothetical protein